MKFGLESLPAVDKFLDSPGFIFHLPVLLPGREGMIPRIVARCKGAQISAQTVCFDQRPTHRVFFVFEVCFDGGKDILRAFNPPGFHEDVFLIRGWDDVPMNNLITQDEYFLFHG